MTSTTVQDDHFQWLEEIDGVRAQAWVAERNAHAEALLTSQPQYASIKPHILQTLNASDRIPWITRRGQWLYNLWQDEEHKRGLWRRCTLDEYRKTEPAWDILLDLDALAASEQENWVWAGATALGPESPQCLIKLSRGGADAVVVREFDIARKAFVDGGFTLPEAKTSVTWIDADTLYVGTDFGAGSMTDSGYPRVIKRWQRGTSLAHATTVFEGQAQDISVGVSIDRTPGHARTVFYQSLDFYNARVFVLTATGALQALDVPSDASPTLAGALLLVRPRSAWVLAGQVISAGSLVVADVDAWLAGHREIQTLFTPTQARSLADYTLTRSSVVLQLLDDVAGRLELWTPNAAGVWQGRAVDAPFPGTLSVSALHNVELGAADPLAEHYLLSYTGFLTPESLWLGQTGDDQREVLKSRPAQFDASGLQVEQLFARSADGTRVPYFVIGPQQASGPRPTLLYGYGGFEVSLEPWYSGVYGHAWLAQGAVWVVANIRGGGEYGPDWHTAAILQHKQRSYDDFAAVAQDLIRRGITTPKQLGIMGGSNGGLLVGATFVQHPELFNAVVCSVPLLDMKRYHTLLAGASWMAEYGNPDDPQAWAFIRKYSPYQNVVAGTVYPEVLFTTSTRDDRVHPGHARKMAARMLEQGHPVFYYENTEGGHGGAADNEQRAHLLALEFGFLWRQLG
ncbi:prolyl oligopeptidase [Silvimonas terrae]|uniref:Prolyl oligopeptidase n=1 Tax=Silvimonas terrae TaxID=300266 RepID=A0A840RJB9_9NEIS|nr:prolyl oligopeptidase family serine peptidase [Silvimonas terrae]MBB5192684.1 prolyl oligopeptidase [Silvimonas terrae]